MLNSLLFEASQKLWLVIFVREIDGVLFSTGASFAPPQLSLYGKSSLMIYDPMFLQQDGHWIGMTCCGLLPPSEIAFERLIRNNLGCILSCQISPEKAASKSNFKSINIYIYDYYFIIRMLQRAHCTYNIRHVIRIWTTTTQLYS